MLAGMTQEAFVHGCCQGTMVLLFRASMSCLLISSRICDCVAIGCGPGCRSGPFHSARYFLHCRLLRRLAQAPDPGYFSCFHPLHHLPKYPNCLIEFHPATTIGSKPGFTLVTNLAKEQISFFVNLLHALFVGLYLHLVFLLRYFA